MFSRAAFTANHLCKSVTKCVNQRFTHFFFAYTCAKWVAFGHVFCPYWVSGHPVEKKTPSWSSSGHTLAQVYDF